MKKSIGKVIFDKDSYKYKSADTIEIERLVFLLATDVSYYNHNFFKKWALEDSDEVTSGGNISYLYKENDFVFIGDLYSEEEDGGPFLKMSVENFVKILDQWDELYKTKPKEILIIQEDDVVRLEGKN